MVVLVTCKNEEDPFKNEGSRVYRDFSRHSRAANSTIRSQIWLKFKLIPAFMVVLVTYKNEEDLINNEGARVVIYVKFSDIQGQVTP